MPTSLSRALHATLFLHQRPHPWSRFEGFYSKFQLPSGAHLILIICSIRTAPDPRNRNTIHVTFYPAPSAADQSVWQADLFPEQLPMTAELLAAPWQVTAREGSISVVLACDEHEQLTYDVHDSTAGIAFRAHSTQRLPWNARHRGGGTPESWLVYLPLPLHWHVHSLDSTAAYTLRLPASAQLAPADAHGTARVHEEKNWAIGFPVAHNWVQGAGNGRYLSLAGGKILGVEAFLVGYRNAAKKLAVDFRPPFAVRALGLAPFLTVRRDWDARWLELDVSDLTSRLIVTAQAPQGSFFSLGAPYPEGFRPNWLAQSMRAAIKVQVLQRRWPWSAWQLVDSAAFENGALEFGGEYYPPRGTDKTVN